MRRNMSYCHTVCPFRDFAFSRSRFTGVSGVLSFTIYLFAYKRRKDVDSFLFVVGYFLNQI